MMAPGHPLGQFSYGTLARVHINLLAKSERPSLLVVEDCENT